MDVNAVIDGLRDNTFRWDTVLANSCAPLLSYCAFAIILMQGKSYLHLDIHDIHYWDEEFAGACTGRKIVDFVVGLWEMARGALCLLPWSADR